MSIEITFKIIVDDEEVVSDFTDDEYVLAERYADDFFTFIFDDNPDIQVEIIEANHHY